MLEDFSSNAKKSALMRTLSFVVRVASDDLRDALSVIFGLSELKARSWSIPSEDPYEEAAQQLLEQAPHSPEYIPDPMELEDHVPVYILKPEHPEDLVQLR
ncbi:hypothetical protein Tco_0587098 [Tanacetum coccineum]